MTQSGKKRILALLLTAAAGAALHFLYSALPGPITALVSPVNESIWEHTKIILWPYLLAAVLINRGGEKHCLRPWLLTALILVAAMLSLGYLYHIALGGESMVFDIGLYLILMALGFVLPKLFPGPWNGLLWELVLWITVALAVAVLLFTFFPPEGILFTDLSGANTWSRIPC